MTTLAAIQGNGWAVIGCDSRIIENNGILIAGSGAGRGSNLLQFGWKAPKPTAAENLDKYITQKFIPAMRKLFIDAGYDMKEDGDAAEHDSSFLVIVRGIIYPIFEDYSWDRDSRGIYYSGSGGDIALGAMEAMEVDNPDITAKDAQVIIHKAISVACKWDIFTAEPIVIRTQYAK